MLLLFFVFWRYFFLPQYFSSFRPSIFPLG